MNASRRSIPSVDRLLAVIGDTCLGRATVVQAIRNELAAIRESRDIPEFSALVARVRTVLNALEQSRIQPVVNATGVIINTNLGRSPLSCTAINDVRQAGSHYVNLEFDLESGRRGNRAAYLEQRLADLCEAEAATVVNNCAAALFVILHHFVSGPKNEVIVSRGELIQIGGSFRIPDILTSAGAVLREVGMTNRTSIADYENAICEKTALILKVHRSNFYMDGFVDSPKTDAVCQLASAKNILYVEDLGSGAIIPTESLAEIDHAQTPAETLRRGADIVCFSGDKLLGGPQAGIIAGNAKLVGGLKSNPIFRALRCDKLILSALQSTVEQYLNGEARESVPIYSMLSESKQTLTKRAEALLAKIRCSQLRAELGEGATRIGGGALPRGQLDSVTIDVYPNDIDVEVYAKRLRTGSPPIIGYIADGCLKIDMRTVFPHQDDILARGIRTATKADALDAFVCDRVET